MSDTPSGAPGGKLGAPLEFLDRGLGLVSAGVAVIGALLLLVMTAVVGYSVALRYLFNRPQVWTDELVGYLLVVLVMAGATEALRRGEHIGVDLITERLSARGRRLAEIWAMAAVVFVAACLVAAGWEVAAFSHSVGLISVGYLEVPMWLPQAAVPAGAGLLALAAFNRLLRLLVGLETPKN
jgi:C4-dicarboxylate transporter DctQ subunit